MIPKTLKQLQKALPGWDCECNEMYAMDRWSRLTAYSKTNAQTEVKIEFPTKRKNIPLAMAAAYRAAKTFERGK